MTKPHKRVVHPHNPQEPLKIWLPRAIVLAQAMTNLEESRREAVAGIRTLPKGVALRSRRCRAGCSACPHPHLSYFGKTGLAETRAILAIAKKNKQMRTVLQTEGQFARLALLAERANTRLGQPPIHADGPYTPVPYHLFAWQALALNREVLDLQYGLRDWNTAHNRAAKGRVTRQGALGFKVKHYRSGIFSPRWTIWTRGSMGQWIGSKVAKPTYRSGYSRPDRQFPIPVKLSVSVINRTGNNQHKETYRNWEKRRAELAAKITELSSKSKMLAQLHLSASRHPLQSKQ
ncbi:hypothetical protein JKG47_01810 [Acidithiobacillus sp. MC6.1]|nr:hypothetical protein [Acidithiobacillus sp. MC6.1]